MDFYCSHTAPLWDRGSDPGAWIIYSPSFWLRHYTFYQLSGLIGLCSPNAKGLHTFLDKKHKAKLETRTYLGPHSYSRINQMSCPVVFKGWAGKSERTATSESELCFFFFFFRVPASQLSTAPSLPVGRKAPELFGWNLPNTRSRHIEAEIFCLPLKCYGMLWQPPISFLNRKKIFEIFLGRNKYIQWLKY